MTVYTKLFIPSRIDEVIRDQDVFPLRKTYTSVDVESKTSKLCLKFTKDEGIGLSAYLTLCFVIKLLDEADDIFELCSYAYLKSIDEAQTTEMVGDRVCVGSEVDLLSYDALVKYCLRILNCSYDALVKNRDFGELVIK